MVEEVEKDVDRVKPITIIFFYYYKKETKLLPVFAPKTVQCPLTMLTLAKMSWRICMSLKRFFLCKIVLSSINITDQFCVLTFIRNCILFKFVINVKVSIIALLYERGYLTHQSNKYCIYRQYRRKSCPNIEFAASWEVLNWMWANTKHVYLNKRANSLHIDYEPARAHTRAASHSHPIATVTVASSLIFLLVWFK